jgi:amino acid permease
MGPLRSFAKEAGLVAATTLGAGIFALPFVFLKAGWLAGLFYLVILAVIIVSVHILYFRVLEKVNEKNRLLGLARAYLGKLGFAVGLFAILGGLILTLVVYLILGGKFVQLLFPSFSSNLAILIFWVVSAMPLLLKERRSLNLEILGIILTAAIIIFIFFTSDPGGALSQINAFNWRNALLPFGAILFALAGWTSVEPVFDVERRLKSELTPAAQPYFALAAGTAIAAVLYVVFVTGIFGSSGAITSDTVSGLLGWPKYKLVLLAILGLFAVWTPHLPIGLEIKHSLENDLHLGRAFSLGLVIFLPIILIFLGLNSFARVVGLVGGVFLSTQYLLMILVGKKVLELGRIKSILLYFVSLIFVAAAVYEVYYFFH